jgi:hypothetical protein
VSGRVRDHESRPAIVQAHDVVQVAADAVAGSVEGVNPEPGETRRHLGKQRALDDPRPVQVGPEAVRLLPEQAMRLLELLHVLAQPLVALL